jgi:hypothetical protein
MKAARKIRRFAKRQLYRVKTVQHYLVTGEGFPRIVFLHTVKTGGTSIHDYFKDYLGSSRSGKTMLFDDFLRVEEERVLVARARKAQYVGGHISWATFQKIRDERTRSFTIFREPYDRLRSLYYYLTNMPENYRGAGTVADIKEMSLREFLTTDHEWIDFYSNNFVARQFAGALDVIPRSREEKLQLAEQAIQNLTTMDILGFHDDFETAFAKIVTMAGLPVPEASPRLNVTTGLMKSDADRKKSNQPFDNEMRALATPLIEGDLIVYEHFNKLRGKG